MTRPEWINRIQAGDVLETPHGDQRLVRHVHRREGKRGHPSKVWVYFAIRRCSWTGRCYTLYSSEDDYLRRMRFVGPFRGKLTALDFRINRDIETCPNPGSYAAKCCEVRSVP